MPVISGLEVYLQLQNRGYDIPTIIVTGQAKENAEEAMRMMEQGTKDTMALLGKAVELGGIATPAEAQVKIQQLWQESLNVLNNNAKEMVQANSKMLQAWTEMAKENVEQASKSAAKAKK